jgi:hypothetical protein
LRQGEGAVVVNGEPFSATCNGRVESEKTATFTATNDAL